MMELMNRLKHSKLRKLGVLLMLLVMIFSSFPTPSYAFNLFNAQGNDGYYLSITNDPDNIRVVPIIVYDNHPVKQKMQAFLEFQHTEIPYIYYHYNTMDLPKVGNGEQGREDWAKEVLRQITNKYPSLIGENEGSSWLDKAKAWFGVLNLDSDTMLLWTFPGFAGSKEAENYQASQIDWDQAMWVSDTLVQEFNKAIKFVHSSIQKYGNKDLEVMTPNQFASMIAQIANHARKANHSGSSTWTYHGVTFKFNSADEKEKNIAKPKGVPRTAYVEIRAVKGKNGADLTKYPDTSGMFIEFVEKGYRKGQKLHGHLNETFKKLVEREAAGKGDAKYLTWKHIVLQSNSLWSVQNIVFTNVGRLNEPGKFEQYLTDMLSNFVSELRQLLGLHSTVDLITNGGSRATDSYYKGIMPKVWMEAATILHWISYAVAWMLIIGAIAKLLVQRNLAAINPSERVDMINGIKNLMIVGFILTIYDVAFAGLAELNFQLVNVFSSASENMNVFGKAPLGMGTLAGVILTLVFFLFDIYYNFFYIARAITVAILYATGPLFVAAIAFGERYRQIFSRFMRELIGNIYVQTFHVVILVFFTGLSMHGTLVAIEQLVLLFIFIPLTRFFKEVLGVSTSTADSLSGMASAVTSGLVAAKLYSDSKKGDRARGQGGASGQGQSDIRMKSAQDFAQSQSGGGSGIGGGPQTRSRWGTVADIAGKTASTGAKAMSGAAKTLSGAGLVIGGTAMGNKGLAAAGGAMMGAGAGDMLNAGVDVASATAAGARQVRQAIDSKYFAPRRIQENNYARVAGNVFNPTPQDIHRMADGSVVEMYNKGDFMHATGITGFSDYDNNGDMLKVDTAFYADSGFDSSYSHLQGTEYEDGLKELVNAFQNGDQEKINQYRERGVMGVHTDSHTNRVSLILDKQKAKIGQIHSSGDNLFINRKVPIPKSGRSKDRPVPYEPQATNPIYEMLDPASKSNKDDSSD